MSHPEVAGFLRPACPLLPEIAGPLEPSETRQHAGEKGASFYEAALRYAQSLWRSGKPAQAILQPLAMQSRLSENYWVKNRCLGSALAIKCSP